uniref:V-set and transmembrane domain containing 2 like n=1 Tax=Pseudonaja textilis TaxID=8673 RepID=A0A670ZLQ0_PSETE
MISGSGDLAGWSLTRPSTLDTPHDMTARAGEDVEMACSFRGSSSPSYSLEIQWWYVQNLFPGASERGGAVSPDRGKDPVGMSCVVKVAGSNISHKLRLSRVKPADEGTYECRVIDFSDRQARHHKAKAYLRVEAEDSGGGGGGGRPLQETQLLLLADTPPFSIEGSSGFPPPPASLFCLGSFLPGFIEGRGLLSGNGRGQRRQVLLADP